MNGNYVYANPKKKYKGMGLRANSLHKILVLPEKTGRKINVDHKDKNELNCQKENLRICTHIENSYNRKQQGGTSIYKGIHWNASAGLWKVKIQSDGKYKGLGRFTDEIAAANCYNYYAMIYHGEFAQLNDCPYMEKEEWLKYKKAKITISKYRGVTFGDNRWIAQIYHEGKNYHIGSFINEVDAALAYNSKAIELKGEKAVLNQI
jgi:hypothetical protein